MIADHFLTMTAAQCGHIYSNGHICLSILDQEWTPVLNASSVLISIQSMLASCKASNGCWKAVHW